MKTDEIAKIVRDLKGRRADDDLVADVEVYGKAGRMLLEFPEDFFTQDGINHALTVLDTGLDGRGSCRAANRPGWRRRRRTHGYYSALDGSVQPYG